MRKWAVVTGVSWESRLPIGRNVPIDFESLSPFNARCEIQDKSWSTQLLLQGNLHFYLISHLIFCLCQKKCGIAQVRCVAHVFLLTIGNFFFSLLFVCKSHIHVNEYIRKSSQTVCLKSPQSIFLSLWHAISLSSNSQLIPYETLNCKYCCLISLQRICQLFKAR